MRAELSPRACRSERAWAAIDWSPPLPWAELIDAEHYAVDGLAALAPAQRIRFSQLATCHTCELFIHFERYLIEYVERHAAALPGAPGRWRRFVAEERRHVDAFVRLLTAIRPDLYPRGAQRFMAWGLADEVLVRTVRPVPFFLLAAMFEEITLWVPQLLAEAPVRYPPLFDVMALHADEERRHIALDTYVLRHAIEREPRWRLRADVWSVLPLLVHCDRRARAGWRRMTAQLAGETALDRATRRGLDVRGA
ncbi:MAG: diiron oxygenase, partial [Deltaproteobacteria bacterium]|nr:diiron oxygenase [Kofleriaceae bacterium]